MISKIKRWTVPLLLAMILVIFGGCEKEDTVYMGGKRGESGFSFTDNWDEEDTKYVLNTSSRRIHLPSCLYAEKISSENKLLIFDLKQALAEDYTYCSHCLPNETDTENEENQNANS